MYFYLCHNPCKLNRINHLLETTWPRDSKTEDYNKKNKQKTIDHYILIYNFIITNKFTRRVKLCLT